LLLSITTHSEPHPAADLDMIEVGNKPDFACGDTTDGGAALARCRSHFTQWTIMKAPLILGNDIPQMDAATHDVLTNADAIAVNQDPLGIQAQRVNVTVPPPAAASAAPAGEAVAVLARCDAARPTQTWTLAAGSGGLGLRIVDAAGRTLCLVGSRPGEEGGWAARECGGAAAATTVATPLSVGPAEAAAGGARALRVAADGAALTFNNAPTASGPLPGTRYVLAGPGADTSAAPPALLWHLGVAGLAGPVRAAGAGPVFVNDMAGGVAAADLAEGWCLDVAAEGTLEVWAGPLTGGRWALSLFNRAGAPADIAATWPMFNVSAGASFAVRDVWAAADRGTFTGGYTARAVPQQSVVYLLLTPAA